MKATASQHNRPPHEVRRIVLTAQAKFAQSSIRDFVPLFVERNAAERLEKLRRVARRSSPASPPEMVGGGMALEAVSSRGAPLASEGRVRRVCVFICRQASLLILPGVITRLAAVVVALSCLGGHSGAAASAAPGGDAPGALTFGGLHRTYLLHAPAGVRRPVGLVLNLHGAGATGGAQAALTNYNAVADQNGFVVVYPDGIDFSWADGRGASIPDRQGVDDVGFLVALINQVTSDFGIERSHVFVTGMSAGAFMATRLACERADVVAAIAPVSGTLATNFPCSPSRPVSVLQVHGTADPVVPYNGGTMVGRGGVSDIVAAPAMADRWRALDGCSGMPVSDMPANVGNGAGIQRVDAGGCADGTEVDFVRVDGGGHTWPAGRFSLPSASVGSTTQAFDASQASGQFFAQHGR